MFINVDKTGSVEAFKTNMESLTANEAVKGLLILACDENGFTPETIDPLADQPDHTGDGRRLPQIIHGAENLSRGTILAGLTTAPNVQFIPGLTDPSVEYETLIDEKFPDIGDAKTMFVFVDGLGNRIVDLLDSLFNIFGLELNYVGGGAGSLSFVQRPCLFTNDGLKEDGAVLALAEHRQRRGRGSRLGKHSRPLQSHRISPKRAQNLRLAAGVCCLPSGGGRSFWQNIHGRQLLRHLQRLPVWHQQSGV
jgi:hypothetical protein